MSLLKNKTGKKKEKKIQNLTYRLKQYWKEISDDIKFTRATIFQSVGNGQRAKARAGQRFLVISVKLACPSCLRFFYDFPKGEWE